MKRFFRSFELNILLSIIISVITVAGIGVLAYRTMTEIVTSISEEAKPDIKLVLLKDILSDLSDAESSVKSYSITNNSDYLSPFYASATSIDGKIAELNKLSINAKEQHPVIDSISNLIEKKFFILKELILSQHDDRVEATLNKLSKKISANEKREIQEEEARIKAENEKAAQKGKKENIHSNNKQPEAAPQKKLNIFQRLFGRKKKDKDEKSAEEHDKTITNTNPPGKKDNTQIKEVKKEIVKIKNQEAVFIHGYRKEQLDLTDQDKIVMDMIRSLIMKLEDNERKNIIIKTQEGEQKAVKANNIIAVFCIIVSLSLFILGYIIISYVRKNNEYSRVLNLAKIDAENLAKAKEAFLANMSHEIRTPMNAIIGFTEQVIKSPLSNQQKEQLEIVKKSSDHLLKIINEILDLSKLGTGKYEFEHIAFKPADIFEEVVMLLKHSAEQKKLRLYFSAKNDIPQVLVGDPVRFKQVLLNLTGNAIKFTPEGEIKIEAESRSTEGKNILLKVSVTDTGIGIPENKLSDIFNEFEQADMHTGRKYGGTGLGLSISKKLVELQNGNIHVESKESKGTSIIFTLPFEKGTINDIIFESEIVTDKNLLKNKKILIADDNEYNRKLISGILDNWNVIYSNAINGKEVIKLLSEQDYDLILMDVLMPEMNGEEATRYIRKKFHGKKANIPIIALTAAFSDDIIKRSLDAGMNDFLNKPFKESELFFKLVSALNPGELSKINIKDKHNHASRVRGKHHQKEILYNLAELKRTANGDEHFVTEMIAVFIRTTEEGIKGIKNSLHEKDWDGVAKYAHYIAPACRHIDANMLLGIIKEIEHEAKGNKDEKRTLKLVSKLEAEAGNLTIDLKKETN